MALVRLPDGKFKTALVLDSIDVRIKSDFDIPSMSWSITEFTEEHLTIRIEFAQAEILSKDVQELPSLIVTFWDTQFFRSKQTGLFV